jgi:5-methylcytosine-specific restriction endonuclease McrA
LRRDRRRVAQGAERIYRRKVYERDDWTCRLCLKPVDRDAVVPAPMAATLDHVVPLSLGGEHVYSNVQCAHFLCNSTKGANVVQLRFAA